VSIKNIMRDLIAGQRVRPRKEPSLLSKAMELRTDSGVRTSADGVGLIRQKPVKTRRFIRVKKTERKKVFSGISEKPARMVLKTAAALKKALPGKAAPVFILALIAFFSIVTLFFDPSFAFPWERDMVPEPLEDGGYNNSLASYAGLLPTASLSEDPIPLDLMETFSWSPYKVKRGDSVSRIAVNHGISMDAVIACNNITNARRLREGEILRIPNMDGVPYTVKKGDSLSKISSSLKVPLEAILDANDIQSDDISQGTVLFIPGARMKYEELKLALGEFFIYPIRGRLTSPYGWRNDPISGVRRYHAAIDLASPTGTVVKAAMDGRVSTTGFNATYGNYIIVTHGSGFQTMYAHLSVISVNKNDAVNQGAKIGEVGNTGYSTGSHLHFAVFKNGKAVNPLDYLHR
jgi:murein DD-endopeptidase MepM/ murein hydrolase activator NlpD